MSSLIQDNDLFSSVRRAVTNLSKVFWTVLVENQFGCNLYFWK